LILRNNLNREKRIQYHKLLPCLQEAKLDTSTFDTSDDTEGYTKLAIIANNSDMYIHSGVEEMATIMHCMENAINPNLNRIEIVIVSFQC